MCKNTYERPKFDESVKLADNAMLKVRPDLFEEWDFEKNDELGLDIYRMTKGQVKKAWWYCEKCEDSYPQKISKKAIGRGCSICSGYYCTPKNSFGGKFPDLAKEWHPTKNGDLTPYDVRYKSVKKAWWICPKCKSSYDMSPYFKSKYECGCPYCSGMRVNHTNSLASLNPSLVKEWHLTKNGNLTPHDVTCKSNKKAWWKCKLGHEWENTINNRDNKRGCPYCSGHKVWRGHNDMWTTNPELASMLADPEDGYKYTQSSDNKVDWNCSGCGSAIKNKMISNINKQGLSCANCSDGVSYPEKVMFGLLTQLEIEFEKEKTFNWSKRKRYDFYFTYNNEKYIVEVHGKQHYESMFKYKNGRTVLEEQENDRLKEQLAKENGINHYIVINAIRSDFEWLKNSILKGKLKDIFDLDKIDWRYIQSYSNGKQVKTVCGLWNSGLKNTKLIGDKLKISIPTVVKYLKQGSNNNQCNYISSNGHYLKKKVIRLSLDERDVVEYDSIANATRLNNFKNTANINACVKGRCKTAGGFKWMYKEDYEKYIEEQKQLA